ncbi:hypothetical protein ACFL02_02205, partial [Planctomycetota bacterium]
RYHQIEKHIDTLEGRKMVRFDTYYIDALDRKILQGQLWADPQTKLPVKIRERLEWREREELNREFTTGAFEFPESGPSNMYDIGVPRDLEIVDVSLKHHQEVLEEIEKSRSPQVRRILEAGEKALEQFPTHTRTVIRLDKDSGNEKNITWSSSRRIFVTYRHDQKIHYLDYDSNMLYPDRYLDVLDTVEHVINWTQTQEPVTVEMCDGERSYRRKKPHPNYGRGDETTVRVWRHSELIILRNSRPELQFWPYFYNEIKSKPLEIAQPADIEIPIGCVALFDGSQNYYIIDPNKDYIFVGIIEGYIKDNQWHTSSEEWFSDFAQLPTGQWYAGKKRHSLHPDSRWKRSYHSEECWNIDITLLDDNEYPPDIFNGEKLLEGAKIITY